MAKRDSSNIGHGDKNGAYAHLENLLRLRHYAKDHTLATRKKSTAIVAGDSKTRFRGRGMEFAEVRPYQPGDDVRTIDWRVTARTMQPYTKLFQEERERPVYLVVDQRSPMFFGSQHVFKSVAAVELATLIGWIALSNNDRIGGLLFGDHEQYDLRARRGKHAILALIHQLHAFNTKLESPIAKTENTTLHQICKEVRRVAKPGSAIFILSDFHDFDTNCEETLTMLSRHTDISLFAFSDPLERELPIDRELTLTNSRERLTVFAKRDTLRSRYKDTFQQMQRGLQIFSSQIGAQLIHVDSSIDVPTQAHGIFSSNRSRGGRRK